jgi:hypothetical protein
LRTTLDAATKQAAETILRIRTGRDVVLEGNCLGRVSHRQFC